VGVSPDAEIRGQVFLPKGIEVHRNAQTFQNTFPEQHYGTHMDFQNLHANDIINLNGSFSETLNKIADIDERSRNLQNR